MGRYIDAIENYQVGLRFVDEDDIKVKLLDGLGMLFLKLKNYLDSESYYKEALQLTETLDNEQELVAKVLNNYGNLLYMTQRNTTAFECIKKSLRILKSMKSHDVNLAISDCYNNIGRIYRDAGIFKLSEKALRKCKHTRKAILQRNSPRLAVIYINLGSLYFAKGDLCQKAEKYYKRSLKIRRNAFGSSHPDVAISLNCLGLFYDARQNYDLAEPLIIEALEIRQRHQSPVFPDIASSMFNVELVRQKLKINKEIKHNLKTIIQIWMKYCPNHPDLPMAFSRLGRLYGDTGEETKSKECYDNCTALRTRPAQIAYIVFDEDDRIEGRLIS
jgi:tetratricopeptide (TPR) repeat protein